MSKTAGRKVYNYTAIRGKTGRARKSSNDDVDVKAERWINAKVEEGWQLQSARSAGAETVHVLMLKYEI
jgi:hypothetical protein